MIRVARLATVGLCATVAILSVTPALAQAQPNLKRWYFAEGSTGPALPFEEEILVGNPNGAAATVTFRFLRDDGSAPIVVQEFVLANSRKGFNVQGMVGDLTGVALEVTSDLDIVVERSMYWGGGRFNFPAAFPGRSVLDMRGGHNAPGVNETRTSWSFAEGSAGFFQTFVLVSNPSDTPAAVRVKYLTSFGEEIVDTRTIAPGARQTFHANDALAGLQRPQVDFAIEVVSDNGVGVVAERAMYWNNFGGGHASSGVTPQPRWLFAEGVQAPQVLDTYVLLFNPNPHAVTVEVNFYGPNGLLQAVSKDIAPRSREQVYAGAYPTLHNQAFSISATAAGNQPIVAERAVYRVAGGTFGDGTVSAGLPAPALKWGFAEGMEGGFQQYQHPFDPDRRLFTTYFQVLNDSDVPVSVRGVFYLEPNDAEGVAAGMGVEHTVVVNPRSRETFAPSLLPGLHNRKFAAFFEASGPIVMERAMYWGQGIKGGHASGGTALPDALPALATPAAPVAPTLTGIGPTKGTPSGGTVVTITGTGFGLAASPSGGTSVSFGATPVPPQNIIVNNANSITVITPPSGRGVAGLVVTTRGVELFNPNVTFEFADPFAAGPAIAYGDLFGVVASVAAARPFDLRNSCHEFGGNNNFMFEVVAELRRRFQTNRWGLNWKRGNVGDLSQDIVNYYSGPEGTQMRNSTQVRIYDIIGGHCGGNPSPFWVDQTGPTRAAGTVGRWTTDPMCRIARYRDAKFANGEWMFPECR
jgi:hypothetical protein